VGGNLLMNGCALNGTMLPAGASGLIVTGWVLATTVAAGVTRLLKR
jgi:hypothetical protein